MTEILDTTQLSQEQVCGIWLHVGHIEVIPDYSETYHALTLPSAADLQDL